MPEGVGDAHEEAAGGEEEDSTGHNSVATNGLQVVRGEAHKQGREGEDHNEHGPGQELKGMKGKIGNKNGSMRNQHSSTYLEKINVVSVHFKCHYVNKSNP